MATLTCGRHTVRSSGCAGDVEAGGNGRSGVEVRRLNQRRLEAPAGGTDNVTPTRHRSSARAATVAVAERVPAIDARDYDTAR